MKKLFLLIVVGFICLQSLAQTLVPGGTISGATWTKAGSPFICLGSISVVSLTIDPGVTVMFSGNYEFSVAGNLIAIGTVCDSIIFTQSDTLTGWQGIHFDNTPASEIAYCRIEKSSRHGLFVENSSPIIRNCCIQNNYFSANGTAAGGGVYCIGNLTISKCSIINNYISGSGTFTITQYRYGGGLYCDGIITINECVISNNGCYSSSNYATSYSYGGGVFVNGTLFMNNCTLNNNISNGGGVSGGLSNGYGYGGGLYVNGTIRILNSIFSYNSVAAYNGKVAGGIYCNCVNLCVITNCSIAYNSNEGIYATNDSLKVRNSIVYFNTVQVAGNTYCTYCDVQGGYTGVGNKNYNPGFVGATDLRIASGSFCVDSGNPNTIYNDACFPPSLGTVRNDMGAHGGPSACNWSVTPCSFTVNTTITNTSGSSCNNGKIKVDLSGAFLYYPRLELHSNGIISQVNLSAGTTTYTFSNLNSGTDTLKVFDANCCEKDFAVIVKCPKPKNGLATTNIYKHSAKLNWTNANCAVGYRIQYRKQGNLTWTTVQVNSTTAGYKVISSLDSATTYEWRIATKCSNSNPVVVSQYSNIQTFATPALANIAEIKTQESINSDIEIVISPNPASASLSVNWNFDKTNNFKIDVMDALGNLLEIPINISENSAELNTASVPDGLYFVRITDSGISQIEKFFVMH